jgi:hypothetical protein
MDLLEGSCGEMGNTFLFGIKISCCISNLCFSKNIIGDIKFQYMDKVGNKISDQ